MLPDDKCEGGARAMLVICRCISLEVNFQTLYWRSIASDACDMQGGKMEDSYEEKVSYVWNSV